MSLITQKNERRRSYNNYLHEYVPKHKRCHNNTLRDTLSKFKFIIITVSTSKKSMYKIKKLGEAGEISLTCSGGSVGYVIYHNTLTYNAGCSRLYTHSVIQQSSGIKDGAVKKTTTGLLHHHIIIFCNHA